MNEYTILAIIIVAVFIIGSFLCRNPYENYPHLRIKIDISGKRNVKRDNEIDRWLCSDEGQKLAEGLFKKMPSWESKSSALAQKSLLRSLREKQYLEAKKKAYKDAFRFRFMRNSTRRKQENYKKSSYVVPVIYDEFSYDFDKMQKRYAKLRSIDFECTLLEYHMENQRRLMTPELRRKIMERDNYTCQKCHTYMPDKRGLHIDHIIPVSKWGKSVPSNLQVLCDRCNLAKSNKLKEEEE